MMGKVDERVYGQVLDLGEAIVYQEGSIVSQTLIGKPEGTVTAFAFVEGEGLSEHTAPFDAFVYVTEGEVDVSLAGQVHRLNAGQAIVMPADVPHALSAVTAFKMLLVMIKSAGEA